MRTPSRRGIAIVAVVAAALIGGYALATAISPSAFVASGTTRYAMVQSSANATTTSSSFVDIPGMSTTITIPSGKTAEVIVTFSGVANTCSQMYVRALIAGSAASPGSVLFRYDLASGADSHAFTFYRAAGAGTQTVKMQWKGSTNCSQQFLSHRTMIVTANIH